MSIIIETKEDIRLLIEFFEQFNLSSLYKKCEDEPTLHKKDLKVFEKELLDAVDTTIDNRCRLLESQFIAKKELNNVISDHMCMIEEAIPSMVNECLSAPVESDDEVKEISFIRDYAPSLKPFEIFGMTAKGCFVNCNGNFLNFSLGDVKIVKEYIGQIEEYPTWKSLSKITHIQKDLLKRICLTYEVGTFDDYLSKRVTGLTERLYPQKTVKQIYKISGMTEEGKFLNKWNGEYFWDIHTILKLQNEIHNYDEYPTGASLSKVIHTKGTTATILAYMLEHHYFDKYLHQWEQIEADKFYGDVKEIPIENNPQKRKENGMV